jgi:carbonic anhydrase
VGRPDPVEALARLRAGNFRFALSGKRPGRVPAIDGQLLPYAVVVGCIDARVPIETVFEQGVGAICVVRSAGHALDRAMVGSIDFAVTELKVSLVVVLGHQDCRAVAAALDAVRTGRRPIGPRGFLVEEIIPAVQEAGSAGASLDLVTRVHVLRTVARLRQADALAAAIATRRIDVVGALYRLDNGHVEVL